MNKTLPIVASAAAAALVLAGCSSGDADADASADPSADPSGGATDCSAPSEDAPGFGTEEDIAVLSGLEWCAGGDAGSTLQFETPSTVSETATLVVDPGEGDPIESGSVVTLDYTITSGGDGSTLFSTYETGAGETLVLDEAALDPALFDAFAASSEGAEIIFASIDATAEDPSQATVYMALTVSSVTEALESAEGEAVEPAADTPEVTIDDEGKPQVSVEGLDKPSELVVQPLITGEGDPLEEGDSAVVHYTGWVWDGEQFDSSWDRGAPTTFPFVAGGLIDGWIEGLAGQNVGSRVLLVIPPELAYGAEGSGEAVPGDATLVFVVDILAAM